MEVDMPMRAKSAHAICIAILNVEVGLVLSILKT